MLGLVCVILARKLNHFLGSVYGFIAKRSIRTKKEEKPRKSVGHAPEVKPPEEPEARELETKIWHQEETDFIFKLNEKVSLALEKELIANYIVEEVYRFLNVSVCALFLLDENAGDLKLEYSLIPDPDMLKGFFLLKGESITGVVFNNRQPLLINDLENDYYYKSLNKEYYLKNSFISVPLVFKNESIGVLNVANKKNNQPFTRKDLEFLINVGRVGAVAFQNVRLFKQVQEDYLKTITSLALIIDARDPYTKRHSENVTRYSLTIAREMGLNLEQTEILKRAGLLHDIGKIGIRDDILLKPGKLNQDEFAQIKTHSLKGEEIIRALPFLKEVAVLVRHHHERFDGNGYPDGKKGENIVLGSRILAVADTFDAMTTDRPYRKGLALETAKEELKRNKFTQFDPQVVEFFLVALNNHPNIFKQP
jgi:putative nucleotidyltransferase with HDIG domain